MCKDSQELSECVFEIVFEWRASRCVSSKVRCPVRAFDAAGVCALCVRVGFGALVRPAVSLALTSFATLSLTSAAFEGACGRASRDARKQVDLTSISEAVPFLRSGQPRAQSVFGGRAEDPLEDPVGAGFLGDLFLCLTSFLPTTLCSPTGRQLRVMECDKQDDQDRQNYHPSNSKHARPAAGPQLGSCEMFKAQAPVLPRRPQNVAFKHRPPVSARPSLSPRSQLELALEVSFP